MAVAMNTAVCHYEYMDAANINDELKCAICQEPFQNPVSLECQHTFCRQCIEPWLNSNTSCPICRQSSGHRNSRNQTVSRPVKTPRLSPVTTRIVINQLDQLLVLCKQCRQINIQRGNFLDHQSRCTKMEVPCLSANIRCPWTGPRDEQANHLLTCSYHQLRHAFASFQDELEKSNEAQQKLADELRKQSIQIAYLRAFINKGSLMSKECDKPSDKCRHAKARRHKSSKKVFSCVLCRKLVRHGSVALHTCSTHSPGNCICNECHNQYCSLKDDNNNDEDDDEEDDTSDDDDDDD